MTKVTEYMRDRATKLRERAKQGLDEVTQADYTSGARHLEVVADEIDNEFHWDDEDD